MEVYGKKINYEKMISAADQERLFSRLKIEGKKYVQVEKRAEYANRKKKNVDLCSTALKNRQSCQPEKAAQCQ